MEIIVNMDEMDATGTSLLNAISHNIGVKSTETFGLDCFCKLMRSRISSQVIVVFLITSLKEIEKLAERRFYLGNANIIIILRKDFDALMPKALSLRPRFITSVNNGFDEVCAVLRKIILNFQDR